MKWFRPTIVMALLALWGTATLHCGMELDGLFGITSTPLAKTTGTHNPVDQDTDPDGGYAIESGQFESLLSWFTIAIPVEQISYLPLELVAPDPTAVAARSPEASLLPMELNPSWVFHRRSAPPSRAPSSLC